MYHFPLLKWLNGKFNCENEKLLSDVERGIIITREAPCAGNLHPRQRPARSSKALSGNGISKQNASMLRRTARQGPDADFCWAKALREARHGLIED